jgi:glyoxylase-like metal-dependent hydrolase (beta-lactamase superfamily II)
MMEFKKINETCYYFESAANIGYVNHGEEGLLIDAGLDKSSIKKVLRKLKEESLPLTHLFITHAHADHYGGAHILKENGVKIIAPKFEKVILENPMLEPLYLFGGNDPLPELRNKFLEGTAIQVDEVVDEGDFQFDSFAFRTIHLPGHSYFQLGILIDNIFYAGDAYFSEKQLHKHKIPYITDADLTIHSLRKVKEIDAKGAICGHGIYEENFQKTIDQNIHYHEKLLLAIKEYIQAFPKGVSHEEIISHFCSHYEVPVQELSQYLLYKTAVTAYLIGLVKRQDIEYKIENYRWIFIAK